ncbi:MAG: TPM domain-containing protein [Acidobacteriota bacterium]|nr:TPM domain-containing protein [Acidobacteriota bacterium]
MRRFHRRKFLAAVDKAAVKKAIEEAERMTSGEIRVSVSTYFWGSTRRAAGRAFTRLGMAATRDRNGVLLFIVPSKRKFVILGDEGIHAKAGQEFWESLSSILSSAFKKGAFTEGLVSAIREAGRKLAAHFPCSPETDVNELSDDVDFGEA